MAAAAEESHDFTCSLVLTLGKQTTVGTKKRHKTKQKRDTSNLITHTDKSILATSFYVTDLLPAHSDWTDWIHLTECLVIFT